MLVALKLLRQMLFQWLSRRRASIGINIDDWLLSAVIKGIIVILQLSFLSLKAYFVTL